ncbi:MAG: thioredoxin family protein [Candidatus Azobacteroides sp.]|nr:thioredoxin family protein [Candidatus Azobacteroides sp.]
MKRTFRPLVLLFVLLSLALFSCKDRKQHFTIRGDILGGTAKTLYFENVGISSISILDSVRLTKSNSFLFRHPRPQSPDFYRLRLGNQIINLAIDSTETIIVVADEAHFAQEYVLEGDCAESLKIKDLTLLQFQTSNAYNALQKQLEEGSISADQFTEEANAIINRYKSVAREYILANFASPSAYFALFQQVNHMLIFDLYNKDDNKLFGAIANLWSQTYPESPRTLQLKVLYTNSRTTLRNEQPIEVNESDAKDYFDISLLSVSGKEVRLSEVGTDKVVLIDFITYSVPTAPAHNLLLSSTYNKYRTENFEIYQVSLDIDDHLWKNAAVNLPWICVRDPQSIYSPTARKYNVVDLPVAFIRNKSGEIVLRIDDFSTLDEIIAKQIKM